VADTRSELIEGARELGAALALDRFVAFGYEGASQAGIETLRQKGSTMRSRFVAGVLLLLAVAFPSMAGIVIEFETSDLGADGRKTLDTVLARDEMLRMEPGNGGAQGDYVMIFRDATMFLVNTSERTYYRMDEDGAKAIASRLSEAMKQMEKQLAGMPAEQRAMMEQMMKGKMPGMGTPPEISVKEEGTEKVGDYSCTKYVVYEDDEKTMEVLAAPLSQVPEAEEVMGAFRGMASLAEKLAGAVSKGPLSGMDQGPFRVMNQMEGFPVLTRQFRNGRAVQETRLTSITSKDLAEDLFSPPDGYKEADPFRAGRRP
jgi:hypothetical protein